MAETCRNQEEGDVTQAPRLMLEVLANQRLNNRVEDAGGKIEKELYGLPLNASNIDLKAARLEARQRIERGVHRFNRE